MEIKGTKFIKRMSPEEYAIRLKEQQRESRLNYQKNLDRKEYFKAYYQKNKEKINEQTKKYYREVVKPKKELKNE